MDTHMFFMFVISGTVSSGMQWQEALKVYSYISFRSGTLLKYTVPSGTSLVTWNFRASRKQDYCDHQQVDVYLHYGSLPVVSPRNEIFPDNFYLDRIPTRHLTLLSDNSSVQVSVSWPTPGSWYSVAFRPEEDNKIQQEGLSVQCDYQIASSTAVRIEPDVETVTVERDNTMVIPDTGKNFRFFLGVSLLQYTVHISQCNNTDCGLEVSLYSNDNTTNNSLCSTPPCSYTVVSPWLEAWHYVKLTAPGGPVSISWNISTIECTGHDGIFNEVSTSKCTMHPKMHRYKYSDRDFRAEHLYIVNDTKPADISVTVAYNKTTVLPFELLDMVDTGGALKWTVSMETDQDEMEHIQICGQITYGKIPNIQQDISAICNTSNLMKNQLQINSSTLQTQGQVLIPYPEAGVWSVSLTVQCYDVVEGTGNIVWSPCSNGTYDISMSVTTDRCVDNACGGHGECKEYIVGPSLIVYSTCNCVAGWRGYTCSDGTEALSVGVQLEDLLLLTLSNLFFIPAIILAIYRKYFTEAIVYIYNMFFSAMYHACDGDRVAVYKYCMIDYKILTHCDFLASVCSLWFTMIAMARLPEPISVALQVTALLVLPIGVLKEHTSLWLIAVPVLMGVIILGMSWGLKCRSRGTCYPTRQRYFVCLMPGFAIAGTGAAVFAFAQTIHNYRYVHSAWHVCLFLSVVFLLPTVRRKGVDLEHSVSEDSIQDLKVTTNAVQVPNSIS